MSFTIYILPVLIISLMIYAWYKKVNAYDSFITGAKEGVKVAFEILPYVASMIIATAVFKSSDFLRTVVTLVDTQQKINIDILTLMFFRPISGMASLAIINDIFKTYGPDSFTGYLASVIQGSTDTTLYIITVYFGAVGIKDIKYSLKAGIIVDILSFIFAFLIIKFILF
ncbi:spore maturation protein [Mycoplasmatota bacterium]|nr:spore maturation protein [Mycoplasmatota bacterium]